MSAGETRQLHWFKLADLIRQKIENGGRRKDKVTAHSIKRREFLYSGQTHALLHGSNLFKFAADVLGKLLDFS